MTLDIDKALRDTIKHAGGVAHDILARSEVVMLAKCVGMLALVVGKQEERIRELEARLPK